MADAFADVIRETPAPLPPAVSGIPRVEDGVVPPDDAGVRTVQPGESIEIVSQPFDEVAPPLEVTEQEPPQADPFEVAPPLEVTEQEPPQADPFAGVINPDDPFAGVINPARTEEKYEATAWEKFKLTYDMSMSDVTSWATWLESKYPMGDITIDDKNIEGGLRYRKPEELYGSEFLTMNEQQRRERMADLRAESIYQKHKELIDSGFLDQREEDPWYDIGVDTLGTFAGALTSPTTLIPVKRGYQSLAFIGGLLSGEHNMGRQLAETGEVDTGEVLLNTAAGAVLTPALVKVARVAGNVVGKPIRARLESKRTAAQVKAANETIDNVNNIITEEIANGTAPRNIPKIVAERTGLSADDILEATAKAERKVFIPTKKDALTAMQMKMADDTVPSTGKMAFADDLMGVLSTKIKNISEPVLGRLRKLDYRQHIDAQKLLKVVNPFLETLNKLPPRVQRILKQRLLNGDFDDVNLILKEYTKNGVKQFRDVRGVLADLEARLKEAGYELGSIEQYFPRTILDVNRLLSKIGTTRKSFITKALERRAKALGIKKNELPKEERVDVINKVMRGYVPLESGLGFTKSRQIARITDDLLDEYADPAEALHTYIRRAINDIEKRKFFGRSAVSGGVRTLDADKSIGNFIDDEVVSGRLSEANADELGRLLKARFIEGEQNPSEYIQVLRNIGHLTTLTSGYSTLTQLGDLGVGAVVNGVRPTLRRLFSESKVKMEDLGLDDVIAEGFANTSTLSKLLHKAFTYSGFRSVDKLGKTTLINTALDNALKAVKTPAGEAALRKKWGGSFGDEMTSLIDDLRAGNITDNVKLFLWNELADVQPISLSEMPVKYLQSPDGRLFYTLKTFAVKQLDMLRRGVFQKARNGEHKEAAKFLVAYMTIVPVMGASVDELKDMLMGREIDIDDFPDEYVENIFKVFMASEYMVDNYLGEGNIAGAVGETILPPTDWMDAIGSDIMGIASGEKVLPEKTIKQLPLVGRFWYEWFGGGMEKAAERKARE
jgi:hypothetical protein